MKLYNCPDCTHTEDTCENCIRFLTYHKSNMPPLNFPVNYPYYPIPATCQKCPNHPSNGGSGICHCILGGYDFTYDIGGNY